MTKELTKQDERLSRLDQIMLGVAMRAIVNIHYELSVLTELETDFMRTSAAMRVATMILAKIPIDAVRSGEDPDHIERAMRACLTTAGLTFDEEMLRILTKKECNHGSN